MSLFKLDKVEEIDLNNESSWKEGKKKGAPPPKDQAIDQNDEVYLLTFFNTMNVII